MSIALVGQVGLAGGNHSSPQTFTYSSSASNTLIFVGHLYNDGNGASTYPVSITDTAGNTWHVSTSTAQNPPTAQVSSGSETMTDFVAWCINAKPVTSVVVAQQNSGSWWRCALSEWSGIVQLDNSWATTTTTGTSLTLGPVPVNASGELVISACDVLSGSETIPTGWTELTSMGAPDAAYYIGPSTGTYSAVWQSDTSAAWAAAVAVFSPVTIPNPASSNLMLASLA